MEKILGVIIIILSSYLIGFMSGRFFSKLVHQVKVRIMLRCMDKVLKDLEVDPKEFDSRFGEELNKWKKEGHIY